MSITINHQTNQINIPAQGDLRLEDGAWTMTLPNQAGDSGTFLYNDGNGSLSWATPASGGGGQGAWAFAYQYGTWMGGPGVSFVQDYGFEAYIYITGYSGSAPSAFQAGVSSNFNWSVQWDQSGWFTVSTSSQDGSWVGSPAESI
jgi:hypothetical protein